MLLIYTLILKCEKDKLYKLEGNLTKRSNIVTRLPTGDKMELPSGENWMFPLLYTLPQTLFNR